MRLEVVFELYAILSVKGKIANVTGAPGNNVSNPAYSCEIPEAFRSRQDVTANVQEVDTMQIMVGKLREVRQAAIKAFL